MKTAICAIIKDEHLYLQEWIEWHLGLGFDAIHLFEDKGSKSHRDIIDKFENVYLYVYDSVKWLQDVSFDRQRILYDRFLHNIGLYYEWIAFIDIDEYIQLGGNYELSDICESFKDYSAVLMSWRMMGASGHIKRPKSIVHSYTDECCFLKQDNGWKNKSFVNVKKYNGMKNPHYAYGYVNTNYRKDINELCYDKIWLNHYFTKSWEDWCDRIFKRGDLNNGHRTLDQFFECNTDMAPLRDRLVNSVITKQPNGGFWLDKERGIIAGGNVEIIKALNKNGI